MKILVINGPNLNLLGKREISLYGKQSIEDILQSISKKYSCIMLDYLQSNIEGELVNYLQDADQNYDGIILNAAAYTHTSIAIADAIAAIQTPVVEVHISNIFGREQERKTSLISANCIGSISGFGPASYELAVHFFNL